MKDDKPKVLATLQLEVDATMSVKDLEEVLFELQTRPGVRKATLRVAELVAPAKGRERRSR